MERQTFLERQWFRTHQETQTSRSVHVNTLLALPVRLSPWPVGHPPPRLLPGGFVRGPPQGSLDSSLHWGWCYIMANRNLSRLKQSIQKCGVNTSHLDSSEYRALHSSSHGREKSTSEEKSAFHQHTSAIIYLALLRIWLTSGVPPIDNLGFWIPIWNFFLLLFGCMWACRLANFLKESDFSVLNHNRKMTAWIIWQNRPLPTLHTLSSQVDVQKFSSRSTNRRSQRHLDQKRETPAVPDQRAYWVSAGPMKASSFQHISNSGEADSRIQSSPSLCCVQSLSFDWFFATPWTVAQKAPLSMGCSRQECWSRLPFPTPGDLPDPEIEPVSPALAGKFFTTSATQGSSKKHKRTKKNCLVPEAQAIWIHHHRGCLQRRSKNSLQNLCGGHSADGYFGVLAIWLMRITFLQSQTIFTPSSIQCNRVCVLEEDPSQPEHGEKSMWAWVISVWLWAWLARRAARNLTQSLLHQAPRQGEEQEHGIFLVPFLSSTRDYHSPDSADGRPDSSVWWAN